MTREIAKLFLDEVLSKLSAEYRDKLFIQPKCFALALRDPQTGMRDGEFHVGTFPVKLKAAKTDEEVVRGIKAFIQQFEVVCLVYASVVAGGPKDPLGNSGSVLVRYESVLDGAKTLVAKKGLLLLEAFKAYAGEVPGPFRDFFDIQRVN